jgi:hypothetical protein
MLGKRQKIIISGLLLATGLFLIPQTEASNQLYLIISVIAASYLLSVWAIYAQFSKFDLINLFVLPVVLTASFALFFGRFETSIEVRSILSVVYVVVMYTILLAENIFNVSTERNIPLVRAARTIGYLSTLFVSFAFFTLLFGLGLNIFLFSGITFLVSSLFFAQGLWQINLKEIDLGKLTTYSILAGLAVGEVALAFGFWPLNPPKVGLAITAFIYVLLGLLQHHVKEDLTRRLVFEYLFVSVMVVFLLFVTTSWGV